MIKEVPIGLIDAPISNYENIDMWALYYGLNRHPDHLVHLRHFYFTQAVASKIPDPEQLYCYPELAKALKKLEHYPTFSQSYDHNVDSKKNVESNKNIFERLASSFDECKDNFHETLRPIQAQFQKLLSSFGSKRYTPIITAKEGSYLVINGLKWFVTDRNAPAHRYASINLLALSGIQAKHIKLEQAILGTSIVVFRVSDHWQNKGRQKWYNLDTLQLLTSKEIQRWRDFIDKGGEIC